jgi:hypothetical protein
MGVDMNERELLVQIEEVRRLLEGAVRADNFERIMRFNGLLVQLYHSLYLLRRESIAC